MSETGVRMDVVAIPSWMDGWAVEIDPDIAELAERFEAAFVRCAGPQFRASCPSP